MKVACPDNERAHPAVDAPSRPACAVSPVPSRPWSSSLMAVPLPSMASTVRSTVGARNGSIMSKHQTGLSGAVGVQKTAVRIQSRQDQRPFDFAIEHAIAVVQRHVQRIGARHVPGDPARPVQAEQSTSRRPSTLWPPDLLPTASALAHRQSSRRVRRSNSCSCSSTAVAASRRSS